MATTSSQSPLLDRPHRDRRQLRRDQTIDEALDFALEIMSEVGVGGLTISEIARRMGIRGPSLYKYFPSLHDVYDRVFARGLESHQSYVNAAIADSPRGVAWIRAAVRATVAWSVANPALAQLMFWRPVPGFEPSAETFQASETDMAELRAEFTEAVRLGELDESADHDDAVRLLTVVISGLISQQMANEPNTPYETGAFTSLTDDAVDMFLAHYRTRGDDHADARS